MLTTLALLVLATPEPPFHSPDGWFIRGKQLDVGRVFDRFVYTLPRDQKVVIREEIPDGQKYDLQIKERTPEGFMNSISAQTPLRWIRKCEGRLTTWHVVWNAGSPPKSQVRLYRESDSYHVKIDEATVGDLAATLKELTDYDARGDFAAVGLSPDKIIKGFESGVRLSTLPEEPSHFVIRFLKEYNVPKPEKLEAKPTSVRAFWNLTFLASNPPSPTATASKIDFTSSLATFQAATLASGLSAIFGTKLANNELTVPVKSVGTSLSIEGSQELVDRIRALLATQIDIPQSQIRLEVDAYQVSANRSTAADADRSVFKMLLAQEVARAYKQAHVQALKATVFKAASTGHIASVFEKRKSDAGVDLNNVLMEVGLDPEATGLLGQSEMMLFLAYCGDDFFRTNYPQFVKSEFDVLHSLIESRLVKPLETSKDPSERQIYADIRALNDAFKAKSDEMSTACANTPLAHTHSAVLTHFARNGAENDATQRAIEDFLVLWIANADSGLAKALTKQDAEIEQARDSGDGAPADLMAGYAQALRRRSLCPANLPDKAKSRWPRLLYGDRPEKLLRAGMKVDDLLQIGIKAIDEDSRLLIDLPFKTWIDRVILQPHARSLFGVKYAGNTMLTVTSRTPGFAGATADSFFPFMPVVPLDLSNLLPAISRKPNALAAEEEGSVESQLKAGGMTPGEAVALKAAFEQAAKQPFYRRLGSGMHLSVFPTMLPNGSTAKLQVKLSMGITPDESNTGGAGSLDKPGPVDVLKSMDVETELLANAFDIARISSLQMNVSAPGKRDWAFPVLSQIMPIRSWFVGPTRDKSVRHEAIVLVRVVIFPRAMDLASRFLNPGK